MQRFKICDMRDEQTVFERVPPTVRLALAVLGPVDFRALRRLAAILRDETVIASLSFSV